jgi:hypothetical protein
MICWSCTRGKLREKDQIPGNCLGDLCVAMLCPCCALIQELNHIDIRNAERAKTSTVVTIVQAAAPPAPAPVVMGAAPAMGGYPGGGQPAYGAPQGAYPGGYPGGQPYGAQPGYPGGGYPPAAAPYGQPGYGAQPGGYPMPPGGGYPAQAYPGYK